MLKKAKCKEHAVLGNVMNRLVMRNDDIIKALVPDRTAFLEKAKKAWLPLVDRKYKATCILFPEYKCPGTWDKQRCDLNSSLKVYDTLSERTAFSTWPLDHVVRFKVIREVAEEIAEKAGPEKLNQEKLFYYLVSPNNLVFRCKNCDRKGQKEHNDKEDREMLRKVLLIS